MRNVAFYHKDTGILHPCSIIASDDAAVALNTPVDHVVIDQPKSGNLDPAIHHIDVATLAVVEHARAVPSAEENKTQQRRVAVIRISRLQDETVTLLRAHALGDAKALKRLQEIEDEAAALTLIITAS